MTKILDDYAFAMLSYNINVALIIVIVMWLVRNCYLTIQVIPLITN
jgi:hypothetical protein